MQASHVWFWLYFSLVENSGASFLNQSNSVIMQNQLLFDTHLKTFSVTNHKLQVQSGRWADISSSAGGGDGRQDHRVSTDNTV